MNSRTLSLRKLAAIAAAISLFSLASGPGATAKRSSKKKPPTTTTAPKRIAATFGYRGFNKLVNDSTAAIEGTVVAVSTPRWNSATGQEWAYIPGHPELPTLLRDVTSSVFTDGRLYPEGAPPAQLVLKQKVGYPSNIEFDAPGRTENFQALQPGAKIFALIEIADFGFEDRHAEKHPTFSDKFHGYWVTVDNNATSVEPGRSLPLPALRGRVIAERAKRDPQRDDGTDVNLVRLPDPPPQPTRPLVPPTVRKPPPAATFTTQTIHSGKTPGGVSFGIVLGKADRAIYVQLVVDAKPVDGIGYDLQANGVPADSANRVATLTKKVGDEYLLFGLAQPGVRSVELVGPTKEVFATVTPQQIPGSPFGLIIGFVPSAIGFNASSRG
jgi:hypothetical protein